MKLFLFRHGEYISSEMNAAQPLSKKGIRDIEKIAHFLQSALIEVEEIQHSGKKRAQQTAEILGSILAPDILLHPKEYLNPTESIDLFLNDIHSYERNIMVVGHLPFFEKLIPFLLFNEERVCPIDFCNSCCVCLENEKSMWEISWIISPKLIIPN